ncbi:hypothetical protein L7F22_018625 [Adiantum nelumboides]|nr:hypothetical protein [Adiantum nelumboides]
MASLAPPPPSYSPSQFQAISSSSRYCFPSYALTRFSRAFESRSRNYPLVMRCSAVNVPTTTPVIISPSSLKRRIVGRGSKLIGCGSAIPKRVLSNDDFSKIVDTSDEWISVCTGIRNRRVLSGGGFCNVLVIGADALSRYVDWTDKGTCILFGDAAGAVVLQAASDDQDSLLGFDFHSDGQGQKHLHVRFGADEASEQDEGSNGAIHLPTKAVPACLKMNGREVFKFAVQCVPQAVEAALKEAGLIGQNLDWLLLHQANQRILDAVAERLHVPSERVLSNLAHYGNTSAASIPLALDEAVRAGKIKPGDILATAGFGAGLTWGSAIIKWG